MPLRRALELLTGLESISLKAYGFNLLVIWV
jgi:hypothetical protein